MLDDQAVDVLIGSVEISGNYQSGQNAVALGQD